MLFPSVSYPTSQLANLLNRAVAKVELYFKENVAVTSYLEERIDLDGVTLPLLKMGLKRAHLMEKETFTRQVDGPVSNETVVDLESFRIKERLPDKFTSKWIRCLCNSTENFRQTVDGLSSIFDQNQKPASR